MYLHTAGCRSVSRYVMVSEQPGGLSCGCVGDNGAVSDKAVGHIGERGAEVATSGLGVTTSAAKQSFLSLADGTARLKGAGVGFLLALKDFDYCDGSSFLSFSLCKRSDWFT